MDNGSIYGKVRDFVAERVNSDVVVLVDWIVSE